MVLVTFADNEGVCWPGQKTLAQMVGTSQPTISAGLKKLEQEGFIESHYRSDNNGGTSTKLYRIHLEVGGDDFYLDLLFYLLKLRCYVVIELKNGDFKPEHIGQLNFYLSAVNSQMKSHQDAPSIGLLLCKTAAILIAGSLLGVLYLIYKGGLITSLRRYWLSLLARTWLLPEANEAARLNFPYALAIASGVVMTLYSSGELSFIQRLFAG